MNRTHWRLGITAALAAVALLGAACSDDSGDSDGGDETAEETTTAVSTQTETSTVEATAEATGDATGSATGTADVPPPTATGEIGEGESVHVVYECADGLTFEAEVGQVPAQWAIITVDGETIEMEQTVSGSGIRYQGGDGYEYRSKGEEATLLLKDDVIRADCVEAPAE